MVAHQYCGVGFGPNNLNLLHLPSLFAVAQNQYFQIHQIFFVASKDALTISTLSEEFGIKCNIIKLYEQYNIFFSKTPFPAPGKSGSTMALIRVKIY